MVLTKKKKKNRFYCIVQFYVYKKIKKKKT